MGTIPRKVTAGIRKLNRRTTSVCWWKRRAHSSLPADDVVDFLCELFPNPTVLLFGEGRGLVVEVRIRGILIRNTLSVERAGLLQFFLPKGNIYVCVYIFDFIDSV